MESITTLKPQALWKNFNDICGIPHPSKKEGRIIEFMLGFGKKLNLETLRDEVGNVIIRKPATPGMQDRKTIVLQAHLDMVPQNNSDVKHNFETDPIQTFIDGEWVRAKGTTLGADNGIGVSAAMAVLESKSLQHGPIECLFTIDEETGMTGAFNLKKGFVEGDILLNLDSEDEGELYIGCAGGIDTTATFNFKTEPMPQSMQAYKINITGLKGGHSGIDINLGRGNANKVMTRLLWTTSKTSGLRLASFNGGSLRNAIPREAFAEIAVPTSNKASFENQIKELTAIIKSEYQVTDPDVNIEVAPISKTIELMDIQSQNNILNALYACPHGVISVIAEMPSVVETSTSMSIVSTTDKTLQTASLTRSSVDSRKEDATNKIESIFTMAGAKVEHSGSYPGWKPNVNSPILKTMKEIYNNKFGKTPDVKVIHAGLECGIIGDVYPNLDMISFGPTIRHPHSPDEKVNIKTVEKFWDYLVETLAHAPKK